MEDVAWRRGRNKGGNCVFVSLTEKDPAGGGVCRPRQRKERWWEQGPWVIEERDLQGDEAKADRQQAEVQRPLLEPTQRPQGGHSIEIAGHLSNENGGEKEEPGGQHESPRPRHRLFMLSRG